jgi:hypothetical protein
MSKHTPTPGPLVVGINTSELPYRVYSEETQSNVGYFYAEADAERFAAHDVLVEALKEALHFLNFSEETDAPHMQRIRAALAALAAAGAKS